MMPAVGTAIPLAALLLFLVQPLVAKVLLPALGGSAAVWATSLVFFQLALLAGYSYAHGLARLFSIRGQAVVHGLAISAALLGLPLDTDPPRGTEAGSGVLFAWLVARVGLPAMILASTSPLLQLWAAFSGVVFPYRLYALSNAASLAGLLAYPFLVEPAMTVKTQALTWSAGVFLFAAISVSACWRMWRLPQRVAAPPTRTTGAAAAKRPRRRGQAALWFSLAGGGTWLLSASTNHLSQDVAAVPLLWVVPLTLYLLSHVLAFARPEPYRRRGWGLALFVTLGLAAWFQLDDPGWPWTARAALHAVLLFVACRVLHGELARRRPPAEELTRFYFWTAAGGAAGGAFVALLAPLVFSEFLEYPLGLWLAYAGTLGLMASDPQSRFRGGRPWWIWGPLVASTWALGLMLAVPLLPDGEEQTWRSVFGVLRVSESTLDSGRRVRVLVHSGTVHGHLPLDVPPEQALSPSGYYGPETGVGLAMREVAERRNGRPLRVGITGLGIGGLAGYARAGDHFRFYEIDPLVVDVARERFPFLSESPAEISVVVGDGRLTLADEVARGSEAPLDLLVLDAFSADSVPGHLLTREAFEIYWQRLSSDGLLLVHVSNRYLDLVPVVRGSARATGAELRELRTDGEDARALYPAHWLLVSRTPALLEQEIFAAALDDAAGARVLDWTDDYSDLLGAIK